MAMTTSSGTMIDRAMRAARLDSSVFEEAEHNPGLQTEALTLVAIVAVLNAVGALIATGEIVGALGGLLAALIGFFIWTAIVWLIGSKVFGGTADYGEVMRTMGYAYVPNILGFLVFIPVLGALAGFIGAIWALVAGVIAIRQAMDFDTGKAVLTVVVGFVVVIIFSFFLAMIGLGAGMMAAG